MRWRLANIWIYYTTPRAQKRSSCLPGRLPDTSVASKFAGHILLFTTDSRPITVLGGSSSQVGEVSAGNCEVRFQSYFRVSCRWLKLTSNSSAHTKCKDNTQTTPTRVCELSERQGQRVELISKHLLFWCMNINRPTRSISISSSALSPPLALLPPQVPIMF